MIHQKSKPNASFWDVVALAICTFIVVVHGFAPITTTRTATPNKNTSFLTAKSTKSSSFTSESTSSTFLDPSSSTSNKNEINPLQPGSIVALITPFLPNGSIDIPSLRTLLQFHIQANTNGLCILGTTGEASLMTMEERQLVIKTVVQDVKGRIPILVGTGSVNPLDTKAMTLQAIDLGCDANLVVTPPYIKPPQRGLISHFVGIAEMGLPTVVYNVPGRTAVDFVPESIAQCFGESEFIIGVKEATGDVSRVQAIREAVEKYSISHTSGNTDNGRTLLLYSGDDATEAEFVLQGGDGCISVTANVAPSKMALMMKHALDGNREEAMKINSQLETIHSSIFVESNPIPAKWAMKRMGKIESAFCRPPLMELDEQYFGLIEESLLAGGCL